LNPYILAALVQLIETANQSDISTLTNQSSNIVKLANAERAKAGINPLIVNTVLSKLAAMKAQDMVDNDYFSHYSPTYGSAFDMMKANGINYIYAGENLAIDHCANNAHTAWMNSKTHRNNILNPKFTEIGIGLCAKGRNQYAYCQMYIGS